MPANLSAVMSFLISVLAFVPGRRAARHGDGHEQTGHNGADENAPQHNRAAVVESLPPNDETPAATAPERGHLA